VQHFPTCRMYRRVMVDYPSCYLTSSFLRLSVVRDLSLNGFRITGLSGLQPKSIVMVRLWLPGQEDSVDIDQAVVRWGNGFEFGVQIIALSNDADSRLALHIEQVLERKVAA